MKKFFAALMLLSAAMLAHAAEFPEGATAPTSAELRQFLEGKVFTSKYANGVGLRYDFKSNGYIFVNVTTGANLSGKWSVKDGQLCTDIQGTATCNDVRMANNILVLKRINGEIVAFNPA
ncbi:hypothetical protein [Hydrogenophaga sp.]|uniref:hypothetical protein n=1 Tax=Hydrogenophaga sp. TaxID=1904254 RepID=UPI003F6EA951